MAPDGECLGLDVVALLVTSQQLIMWGPKKKKAL